MAKEIANIVKVFLGLVSKSVKEIANIVKVFLELRWLRISPIL